MLAARLNPAPAIDVRPTTPADAPALSDFLRRMFRLGAGASSLSETHMRWKYWSSHPAWTGSRSFAARHHGAIVAHAAAWPVLIRVPGELIPAVHVIDWAADPEYPGAGIWLLRHVGARVRLMIATGGSDITRRILPAIGFHPRGELCQFACPVRPLGQALTTVDRSWRLPARLLRNTLWRGLTPLSLPEGWRATPLAPEDVPERLWPRPDPATAVTARGADVYRYVIDSPCARHALFGLEKRGTLAGYFCLSFASHVARIADLWLASTEVEDWCAGFRTAASVAARDDDVYEVSAWASTAVGKDALLRGGFRVRDQSPVSLFGDAGILQGRTLHVQMLDSDAGFLYEETVSYLT